LANRPRKALAASDRQQKTFTSWASTRVVNATVRASDMLPEPGTRPPGSTASMASSVATAITVPRPRMSRHMAGEIAGLRGSRGGRRMT
jgi:hypothetical protein